jgi:glycosyltransferase involved in cell wall biosynthesis
MKDVTILIPTYNEEKHIEQAILSAIYQAEYVIVSDNCSTDRTPEICDKLSKEFNNLIVHKQTRNIGSIKNAEFLYSQVKTKYVMNMGGHDYLAPNYVKELKKLLENDKDAVMSYSKFINVNDDDEIIGYYDANELTYGVASDDSFVRIYTLIKKLSNCSIFFGLCRTQEFINSCDYNPVSGIDHMILCNLVSQGKFIQSINTVFYRRYSDRVINHVEYMKKLTAQEYIFDLSYMCKMEYKIINKLKTDNIYKLEYFAMIAKHEIQKRFARLCLNDTIEKLKLLSKSNEIFILYGSGSGADIILDIMANQIICIIDKDTSKHGSKKKGISVVDLDFMQKNNKYRIINSILGVSLMEELISFGIEYERIISLNILDDFNYSNTNTRDII